MYHVNVVRIVPKTVTRVRGLLGKSGCVSQLPCQVVGNGLLCLRLIDGKLLWHRKNAYRDVTDDELWKSIEAELAVAAKLLRRNTAIQASLKELSKLDEKTAEDEAQIIQLTQQSERLKKQLKGLSLAAPAK